MTVPRTGQDEIRPLTGIRFIAALWVVLYHITPQLLNGYPETPDLIRRFLEHGFLGVDLFFSLFRQNCGWKPALDRHEVAGVS